MLWYAMVCYGMQWYASYAGKLHSNAFISAQVFIEKGRSLRFRIVVAALAMDMPGTWRAETEKNLSCPGPCPFHDFLDSLTCNLLLTNYLPR